MISLNKKLGYLLLATPLLTLLFMSQLSSNIALAQWVNHYPRLDDFGQHTNLEQHELPILANGISDPAPSHDGKSIAIVSKGWL
jgi:TolB protein